MSGGAMVWLTDDELERLDRWFWYGVVSGVATRADEQIHDKFEALREAVACKVTADA